MQERVLGKYFRQEWEWNVALSILIFTGKIKSRLLLVNMEVLKVLITFSSNVKGMLPEETGSYPMTSTAIILTIFFIWNRR